MPRVERFEWGCDERVQLYIIEHGWVSIGGGSSGDCSACVTVKGYIGPGGKMHKAPYLLLHGFGGW